MTKKDAIIISRWQYPEPYTLYNEPLFSTFSDSQLKSFTIFETDHIIGFINLLEESEEVFFGIGIAPEECSKGYGYQITLQALEIARKQYPDKPVYLEVRTWNTRAVNCYQKAGFIIEKMVKQKTHLGDGEFYRMVAK